MPIQPARVVAIALLSVIAAVVGFFIANPIDAATETTISVTALGDEGDELIEVIADGQLLQTFTLSTSLESYEIIAPTRPTNVRVRFINDRYENGFDRNVVVQAVTVAGAEYSPMDVSVLSTGTYQQGKGCSQGTARSVHLHCNGYFEFRIDAAPVAPVVAGTTRIEVQAQGRTGDELIELRLGSDVLATWTLSQEPAGYTHDLVESPAGQNLSVAFVNDARTDAGDRTVQIDFLAVNGRKIEAEDPAVYSEGSHDSSTGCAGGNKSSEFLHCPGFMRFSIPVDAPVSAEPVDETPVAPVADPQEVSKETAPAVEDTGVEETAVDETAGEDTAVESDSLPAEDKEAEASSPDISTTPTTNPLPTPDVPDNVEVSIFARGNTGTERIELRLDNRTVKRIDVSKNLAEYTFSADKSIDSRSLAVHFVNDRRTNQGDRNVTIDRIEVGGKQFQTEASNTEVLGSWTNGSCKNTGNHRAETLTCNGYAQYDIGSAGQLQSTTPEARAAEPTSVAAFPKAGHNGQVGCVGECKTIGFQNLDGANGVVLENVIISNSGGPCLSIRDASNITIRNVTLRNCATNISKNRDSIVDITDSSNVTITGSLLIDNASRSVTNFDLIQVEDSTKVTIRNNEIRNVNSNTGGSDTGNRAIRATGNKIRDLIIDQNSFYNPGRNALQITRAQNITGVRFTNNRVEGNAKWNTEFEDMLNFFSASGTSSSPIIVTGNYLRNGGPSATGTAIILGDGEGRAASGYINVERNVIVDPGHVGINVAGGHNFTVRDNIIYGGSDVGIWTATGLTINHYRYTPECRDHVISGNRVYFKNQHRQHSGSNHIWNPGTCRDNVKFFDNSIGDRSLTYDVWDLQ